MNCIEYRAELGAGAGESEAMRTHRLGCAACSALFTSHAEFERELRTALEVPVPAGFEERVLDPIARPRPAVPPLLRRRGFLAAAAGLGAAAVGVGLWRGRDDPLALACILFVIKEEEKSIRMGAMPRAEAARVLAGSLPLERIEALGQIRHVGPCEFNGGTAYHVVLALGQDKVTLLVMPHARLSSRLQATHDGFFAAVVPLPKGSVGIVGSRREVVASVAGAVAA